MMLVESAPLPSVAQLASHPAPVSSILLSTAEPPAADALSDLPENRTKPIPTARTTTAAIFAQRGIFSKNPGSDTASPIFALASSGNRDSAAMLGTGLGAGLAAAGAAGAGAGAAGAAAGS